MLVKRYVVKEMPEAVAMIREDLGKDAVILSTKKIQSRGFLGLFAKTHIEVVAAANEQEQKAPREPATPIPPVTAPIVPRQTALGAYNQVKTPVQSDSAQSDPAPIVAPNKVTSHAVAQRPDFVHRQTQQEPSKQQTETAPVAFVPAKVQPAEQSEGQVLKEVQELRSLIRSFLHQNGNPLFPEPVAKLRKQLLSNDFDEERVDQLIEKAIRQIQQDHEISEQEFRDILTNFINEELAECSPPAPMLSTTRIASFLGPTGVGKTTTIAKLAAEQVLTHEKKVGLITTDTYRIAAVEQLRTYANILNVPLEVCYSPEDMQRSIDKFADRDLILVDTAGRNFSNELHVRELKSYLQILRPDETYLVLSLTTRATDLAKIVSNFAQVPINKFLFTKADETSSYGAIYNLALHYKIPLSYVTTGQNVPDDIEVVSTKKLAGLLVGAGSDV